MRKCYIESRRRRISYTHTKIGHISRRNCLLKHSIEVKTEEGIRSDGKTRKRT